MGRKKGKSTGSQVGKGLGRSESPVTETQWTRGTTVRGNWRGRGTQVVKGLQVTVKDLDFKDNGKLQKDPKHGGGVN